MLTLMPRCGHVMCDRCELDARRHMVTHARDNGRIRIRTHVRRVTFDASAGWILDRVVKERLIKDVRKRRRRRTVLILLIIVLKRRATTREERTWIHAYDERTARSSRRRDKTGTSSRIIIIIICNFCQYKEAVKLDHNTDNTVRIIMRVVSYIFRIDETFM